MIFAFIDYVRYCTRRGQYSHSTMEKKGLRLATEENFPDYREYNLGDMIFASTANSFLSWLVMYWENGVISHTAMFYGGGIVHDCTTSGIVRHSFANYLDGKSYLEVRRLPAEIDRVGMKAFMDRTLGARYNWAGVARLALLIASGAHPSFSWKLYFDIAFLVLLLFGAISLLSVTAGAIPLFCLGVYTITVFTNRIFSKRWKQLYEPFAQKKTAETGTQYESPPVS